MSTEGYERWVLDGSGRLDPAGVQRALEQLQRSLETGGTIGNRVAALEAADAALDARLDTLEAKVGAIKLALPLDGVYTNYGGGWEEASYMRVGNVVLLQGLVTKTGGSGTPAVADVIGTLPAGFRPAAQLLFAVWTGVGEVAGRINIQTSGAIEWAGGATGNTDFVSLSGVSFLVEP